MERMMMVLDIPADTTAEQAEEILNKPFEDGYYLASIVGWDRFTARAFFRRRVREGVKEEREAALTIVRDNKDKIVRQIQAALAEVGIKRSKEWVSRARAEVKDNRV